MAAAFCTRVAISPSQAAISLKDAAERASRHAEEQQAWSASKTGGVTRRWSEAFACNHPASGRRFVRRTNTIRIQVGLNLAA
eukprot:5336873-Prymnesium_polylepis.1